jgi:hypothetical protein
MPSAKSSSRVTLRTLIESVSLGVAYGLLLRMAMKTPWLPHLQIPFLSNAFNVMTVAFLFVGPVVMGILTIRRATTHGPVRVGEWIVLPWVSVLFTFIGAGILLLEGSICLIFALPFALLGASIGGVIGGLLTRHRNRLSNSTTAYVALLPFLLAPIETHLTAPTQTRTVESEIRIHASPAVVWRNIERVPAISPAELRPTWAQRIGFPRPVEATLSYEGVGGVRHASFEHGLLFIETVTDWQPEQRLAFSIKADTAAIPPTTLDEHVTIGGRYFDVLNGEYRIERLSDGDTLLLLTSHQRLSTTFNGYAGLWSDAIMQNLQTSILQVIQHRAEARKL